MKLKFSLILIAALPLVTSAQKNYPALLDQYMKAQVAVHDFSGSVLVARKGKIIYQKGYGLANREWTIPNTKDTRFQIASITKQFTATAILQLAEQGKLKLDDKVSQYFPGFPKGDSITIHMLLNHTSGIFNYLENPDLNELNPNIPIEQLKDTLISLFRDKPFYFSPGTFWRYSNSGYVLLGYIIEQVSGETYRNYIHKNLLVKAGMINSDIFRPDSIIPHHANGYIKSPRGWINKDIIAVNAAFAAGALFSTTGDLLKWNEALFSGKLISKESLAKMNLPNAGDRGAGYGVFVEQFFNHKAIFHSGGISGFNSFMIRYPDEDICIIILTNRETNLDFIPKGLAAILFDKEVLPAYKRRRTTIDTILLTKYAGTYEVQDLSFSLDIVAKDGQLYLRFGRDIELAPESSTKFYISEPDVDIQVEYVLNARKEISHIYFIEGGVRYKGHKK